MSTNEMFCIKMSAGSDICQEEPTRPMVGVSDEGEEMNMIEKLVARLSGLKEEFADGSLGWGSDFYTPTASEILPYSGEEADSAGDVGIVGAPRAHQEDNEGGMMVDENNNSIDVGLEKMGLNVVAGLGLEADAASDSGGGADDHAVGRFNHGIKKAVQPPLRSFSVPPPGLDPYPSGHLALDGSAGMFFAVSGEPSFPQLQPAPPQNDEQAGGRGAGMTSLSSTSHPDFLAHHKDDGVLGVGVFDGHLYGRLAHVGGAGHPMPSYVAWSSGDDQVVNTIVKSKAVAESEEDVEKNAGPVQMSRPDSTTAPRQQRCHQVSNRPGGGDVGAGSLVPAAAARRRCVTFPGPEDTLDHQLYINLKPHIKNMPTRCGARSAPPAAGGRLGAGGRLECAFCKNNGAPPAQYTSHRTHAPNGKVSCPKLRQLAPCKYCGACGDDAHTFRRCPYKPAIVFVDGKPREQSFLDLKRPASVPGETPLGSAGSAAGSSRGGRSQAGGTAAVGDDVSGRVGRNRGAAKSAQASASVISCPTALLDPILQAERTWEGHLLL